MHSWVMSVGGARIQHAWTIMVLSVYWFPSQRVIIKKSVPRKQVWQRVNREEYVSSAYAVLGRSKHTRGAALDDGVGH